MYPFWREVDYLSIKAAHPVHFSLILLWKPFADSSGAEEHCGGMKSFLSFFQKWDSALISGTLTGREGGSNGRQQGCKKEKKSDTWKWKEGENKELIECKWSEWVEEHRNMEVNRKGALVVPCCFHLNRQQECGLLFLHFCKTAMNTTASIDQRERERGERKL